MIFNVLRSFSQRGISSASVLGTCRNSEPVRRPCSVQPCRSLVYKETGAWLDPPERVRFGFLKALLVVITFVYLGGVLSKTGATFLEENEIFIPGDDDDDD